MQIDESCVSFESGFGPQKRRLTKDRTSGILESDIAVLEQKSKGMWGAIEKVREANGVLKREVQSLADGMREDFKQKAKLKTERIEAILAAVDAKVQFVVESCDRTVQQLSQQLATHVKSSSKEAEERQVILASYSQMSERVRVLQHKTFSYRHVEEDFKRQLEALTQQNGALVQELNSLAARSNEKIEQLESQLRQKVDELRRKEIEWLRKEETLKKDHEQGKIAFGQPSLLPQHHPVHQQNTIPQPMFSPQGQKPMQYQQQAVAPQANSQQQRQPAPQQELMRQPPAGKPLQPQTAKQVPLSLEQDVSISVSRTAGHHNNAIEIKPDFFKGGQDSQLSEYSEVVEYRGINLKSLNKQEPNGINVRKLKESSDSGGMRRFNKKEQNHRFDYLLSNLAATQGESTQIFEGYNESIVQRQQPGYQHTPNRR